MIAASGRFDLPFTCVDSTGAATSPTGTPTGTLVKNGTDLGTTVTVTMTGAQGIASCTIPSDAAVGDRFYLRISAVISAVTYVVAGPSETVDSTVYSVKQKTDILPVSFPANFTALGINSSGHISRVVLADTVTTLTGHTAQTGDCFGLIGVAGAGLTNLGDARLDNLDAPVSETASQTSVGDLPTNAELAAALVALEADAETAALWAKRGASVLVGTISTAGTSSEVYTVTGLTTTVAVDENGNRSSVVFS